jgi:hypothetical protein
MRYIRVRWLHDDPNEPVWLISEISNDGWETRKVEIFPNGSKGYASRESSASGTRLGNVPVPSLNAISAYPQFVPTEISAEDFESVWDARLLRD